MVGYTDASGVEGEDIKNASIALEGEELHVLHAVEAATPTNGSKH